MAKRHTHTSLHTLELRQPHYTKALIEKLVKLNYCVYYDKHTLLFFLKKISYCGLHLRLIYYLSKSLLFT